MVKFLVSFLFFLICFAFPEKTNVIEGSAPPTVQGYFDSYIKFLNWQKKVDSIRIELSKAIHLPAMEKMNYTSKDDPQILNHEEIFRYSSVINVKSNHSYHVFHQANLTNDCWVSFFPEMLMCSAKVVFKPDRPMYFYDLNFFFTTGVSNGGEMVYHGVLNAYTKNGDNGLTFTAYPVRVKVHLKDNI